MKAYLALNNKTMKNFIINSDLFDIRDDLDDYDIMFCDTIKLGKKIKSKIKVYLACHYFEHLNDLEKYSNYNYFIGFGNNKLYDMLCEKCELEPSKIFNGFVKPVENIEIDVSEDMVLSFLEENHNNNEDGLDPTMFKISQDASKTFFQILQDSNFNVIFNHPLPVPIPESKKDQYQWVDDVSITALEKSNIFFTDSLLNCRLYFNQDILQKTILQTPNYSKIKNNLSNYTDRKKRTSSKRNIPMTAVKNIHKFNSLYIKEFGPPVFNNFFIDTYVNSESRLLLNKSKKKSKTKPKHFMVYSHSIENTTSLRRLFPLYMDEIEHIMLYKTLINFDKVEDKSNKNIIINDISSEFIETLEKIKND